VNGVFLPATGFGEQKTQSVTSQVSRLEKSKG
jgi:hypothetical protein